VIFFSVTGEEKTSTADCTSMSVAGLLSPALARPPPTPAPPDEQPVKEEGFLFGIVLDDLRLDPISRIAAKDGIFDCFCSDIVFSFFMKF
jgi:hypothetical protein